MATYIPGKVYRTLTNAELLLDIALASLENDTLTPVERKEFALALRQHAGEIREAYTRVGPSNEIDQRGLVKSLDGLDSGVEDYCNFADNGKKDPDAASVIRGHLLDLAAHREQTLQLSKE